MDLYAENILDHYRNPRGKTLLSSPTVEHEEINLACGDVITLQLRIEDGIVCEVGWDGIGCAISQAGMSMLADEIIGKTLIELDSLSSDDIHTLLGIPITPRRLKCALLCLDTMKNALTKASQPTEERSCTSILPVLSGTQKHQSR